MMTKQLARLGREAYALVSDEDPLDDPVGARDSAIIRAFAAMLVEALKVRKQREKKPLTERAEYARGLDRLKLMQPAREKLLMSPVAAQTLCSLGRLQFEDDDFVDVARWIQQGGLDWFTGKPTLSYAVRSFTDLVARARDHVRPELPTESALDRARREAK